MQNHNHITTTTHNFRGYTVRLEKGRFRIYSGKKYLFPCDNYTQVVTSIQGLWRRKYGTRD